MKLKLLDLFSGIGGFSLGFEKTGGFETIAFCEKDKFCQKVLAKHWNNIKIYDEIRNLKGIQADVITGGFPCQPFSTAGKRKGTDDDRYLWDETLRVIAETKPIWFAGENVEGIINIEGGTVLQQIQKDLEAENFQVQCFVIPASGIGAWHQRKRVWIIANSSSKRLERQHQKSPTFSWQDKRRFIGEQTGKRKEESWWQIESKLRGVPDGISYELDKDRINRIKALGNSIVPEIAYEIAKAILVAENG